MNSGYFEKSSPKVECVDYLKHLGYNSFKIFHDLGVGRVSSLGLDAALQHAGVAQLLEPVLVHREVL